MQNNTQNPPQKNSSLEREEEISKLNQLLFNYFLGRLDVMTLTLITMICISYVVDILLFNGAVHQETIVFSILVQYLAVIVFFRWFLFLRSYFDRTRQEDSQNTIETF